MAIVHLPAEALKKLREHGHPDFWEVAAYGDNEEVTLECTKCGEVLLELCNIETEAEAERASNPDVKDIVRAYLTEHGYGGLVSNGVCACLSEDLAPCGEIQGDCMAGYRQEGCAGDCGEGCDFHIVEERPEEGEEESA